MIDLHCHILPGIDDGPVEMQTSIDMARIAADDGIKTIVAPPHI
jgi:protein-tyrosine phosphatase